MSRLSEEKLVPHKLIQLEDAKNDIKLVSQGVQTLSSGIHTPVLVAVGKDRFIFITGYS